MMSTKPFPCLAASYTLIISSLYLSAKCCNDPKANMFLYFVDAMSDFLMIIWLFVLHFFNMFYRTASTFDEQSAVSSDRR